MLERRNHDSLAAPSCASLSNASFSRRLAVVTTDWTNRPPGDHARGRGGSGRVVRGCSGHFLALQHVQNRGISGRTYPDPLDDTTPGADNLMKGGTLLTPHQAFALSRSALLVTP